MSDNIIPFSSLPNSAKGRFVLQIYFSASVQKLLGVKPAMITKDTEADTNDTSWLSRWRCEHICSDKDNRHLFLFTHATSFFSMVIYQQGLDLHACLQQFQNQLLQQLEQRGQLPDKFKIQISIIKGNPRGLITTMNQILYECDVIFENFFKSYEQLEQNINHRLRSKEFFRPEERFTEQLLQDNPLQAP